MPNADVEKLLRQEHIRPEDLLTDGPNNRLNQQINTEETTVGNTKGKHKKAPVTANCIRFQRELRITKHEDVLRIFLPYIAFGASLLLFLQSLIAAASNLFPVPNYN